MKVVGGHFTPRERGESAQSWEQGSKVHEVMEMEWRGYYVDQEWGTKQGRCWFWSPPSGGFNCDIKEEFISVVKIDAELEEQAREEGEKKKVVFKVPWNMAIVAGGTLTAPLTSEYSYCTLKAMTHIHRPLQMWTFRALSKSVTEIQGQDCIQSFIMEL